jgi:hypothetical protein
VDGSELRIYVASGDGPDVLVVPWPGSPPVRVPAGSPKTYLDLTGAPAEPWELTVWDTETKAFLASWEVGPGDGHLGLLVRMVGDEIVLIEVEAELC